MNHKEKALKKVHHTVKEEIKGQCESCGKDYKFKTHLGDGSNIKCPHCKKGTENFDTTKSSLMSPLTRIDMTK